MIVVDRLAAPARVQTIQAVVDLRRQSLDRLAEAAAKEAPGDNAWPPHDLPEWREDGAQGRDAMVRAYHRLTWNRSDGYGLVMVGWR